MAKKRTTKPIWKSKINWLQTASAGVVLLSDPGTAGLIPPVWLPKIILLCNVATIVLRTFFSGSKLRVRPRMHRRSQPRAGREAIKPTGDGDV